MSTYTRKIRPAPLRQKLEFPGHQPGFGASHVMAIVIVILLGTICFLFIRDHLHLGSELLPTLQSAAKGALIYDRNDKYVCTVHADRDKQTVALSAISDNMRMAVLAAEDHRFYEHHGIDLVGLVRAFNKNQKAGHIVEGGSTITQQLVRGLYLDKNDRSYGRKIKEVFLAAETEICCSKAKILESYLNEIYFGDGSYGIERAANNYFNKHASELSISESAFLAGLIKSPSVLGDPDKRALATSRQHDVLDKMVEYGFISQSQSAAAKAQKLVFQRGENPIKYPYYIACTVQELHKVLGDKMWSQSIKVYTNLDPDAQEAAVDVLNKGIKSAPKGVNQGALVTISVDDGAVLAMVGGVGNYQDNQWNRAVYPHTAGSSFKPFVYLTGLIKGVLQPDTLINDTPLSLKDSCGNDWIPKNFDGKFKGWLTVRDALAYSRNVCAVRVALATGLMPIVEIAQAAGIRAQMDPYPSLALGACAISPLDMATAYSTLARDGVYMPPQIIRTIKSADDRQTLNVNRPRGTNLPAGAVAQLVDIMQDVVRRGTGTQAKLPGVAVAGKTGTADGSRDIWFCGFTPDTVTVVWGGSDANQKIAGHNVTGGSVMAGIWRQYMTAFYTTHKASTLTFAEADTKLATVMPRYDDSSLVNGFMSKQADSDNVLPGKRGRNTSDQVVANMQAIAYNASRAVERGIGSAAVLQGAGAIRRWQSSRYDGQQVGPVPEDQTQIEANRGDVKQGESVQGETNQGEVGQGEPSQGEVRQNDANRADKNRGEARASLPGLESLPPALDEPSALRSERSGGAVINEYSSTPGQH